MRSKRQLTMSLLKIAKATELGVVVVRGHFTEGGDCTLKAFVGELSMAKIQDE